MRPYVRLRLIDILVQEKSLKLHSRLPQLDTKTSSSRLPCSLVMSNIQRSSRLTTINNLEDTWNSVSDISNIQIRHTQEVSFFVVIFVCLEIAVGDCTISIVSHLVHCDCSALQR